MSDFSKPPPDRKVVPVSHRKIALVPLVPLELPPEIKPETLLPFPFPPRPSLLDAWYTRSTHYVPAAYPRSTPDVPPVPPPKWSANKEEYKANVEKTSDKFLAQLAAYVQDSGTSPGSRKPLITCISRFVKKGIDTAKHKSGLTLLVCHATGFGKEMSEPAMYELVKLREGSPRPIDEIWLWEAVNHGESALVNRSSLGGLYDWKDNSRDILHFLQYYLPSSVSLSALPDLLPRLPESVTQTRVSHGFNDRTLIGMGHSFGGCSIMLAAYHQPKLFSSLVMVDAMIMPPQDVSIANLNIALARTRGALQRRDRWSSREEARQLFTPIPFFSRWHPAVLDLYLELGLWEDPRGGVQLTTLRMQEAATFADGQTQWDMWELLPTLDDNVSIHWLIPEELPPSQFAVRSLLINRRPTNCSGVFVPTDHLIGHEKPEALAREVYNFLETKYGSRRSRL